MYQNIWSFIVQSHSFQLNCYAEKCLHNGLSLVPVFRHKNPILSIYILSCGTKIIS